MVASWLSVLPCGGHKPSKRSFTGELENEIGKRTVSGRLHRTARRIQNDYEISDTVLGSGLSGDVRLARSRSHPEQKVAVKVLSLEAMEFSHMEQLKSEVRNFMRMDHPHVTRLYDVYESLDALSLVMECMEGGELFDRLAEQQHFDEEESSDALRHMLLALNYIHRHGIVHRDLKLENFLYDKKGSKHLKLIDFGFSKHWDARSNMESSLGTLSYTAPEVLKQSYTSQCDLWSLGVIAFVLLSGYMPFPGSGQNQMRSIVAGRYRMKPEVWDNISEEAKGFVTKLLEVDPPKRLTAKSALEHPFIALRHQAKAPPSIDPVVLKALKEFGTKSKFRRCCKLMMAWTLSNEQRAKVRQHFLSLDTDMGGTISIEELRTAMDALGISDEHEVQDVFEALDSDQDNAINYSDFLAAMVSTQIDIDEELMKATFRKFDSDNSGYITNMDLRRVVGETFAGVRVDTLLRECSQRELSLGRQDGISYPEFAAYLGRKSVTIPARDLKSRAARKKSTTTCGACFALLCGR